MLSQNFGLNLYVRPHPFSSCTNVFIVVILVCIEPLPCRPFETYGNSKVFVSRRFFILVNKHRKPPRWLVSSILMQGTTHFVIAQRSLKTTYVRKKHVKNNEQLRSLALGHKNNCCLIASCQCLWFNWSNVALCMLLRLYRSLYLNLECSNYLINE